MKIIDCILPPEIPPKIKNIPQGDVFTLQQPTVIGCSLTDYYLKTNERSPAGSIKVVNLANGHCYWLEDFTAVKHHPRAELHVS